jgi:regulator of sigma E protease
MDQTGSHLLETLTPLLIDLTSSPLLAATSSVADWMNYFVNILTVAIGLGLVIFFHELGHFAVAKWCNVFVERFSIGFGPILFSKKYGETEYALSAIPFGGYVKMLGQDDADPNQMADENLAEDPRSYTAKNVWQRMAIISAGVTMNIITGLMFFAAAYGIGLEERACSVGHLVIDQPAWLAGMRPGDRITKINNESVNEFSDIMRKTLLSTKNSLQFEGVHLDQTKFNYELIPKIKDGETRPMIGVAPARGLVYRIQDFHKVEGLKPLSVDLATPAFKDKDVIKSINGKAVQSFPEMQIELAHQRDKEVTLVIERKEGEKTTSLEVKVPPSKFRTLGITMDIGQIVGIQKGSPAEQSGFKTSDKILSVDGKNIGTELDPIHLPEYFAEHHGQPVQVIVKRETKAAAAEEITISITPEDRPGWLEIPLHATDPMSIPAIGIAYHQIPTVLKILPGSPAEGKVFEGDIIKSISLLLPTGMKKDLYSKDPIIIQKDDPGEHWDYLCSELQMNQTRDVQLTVVDKQNKTRTVLLTPVDDPEHFSPSRGFLQHLEDEMITIKATSFVGAVDLALEKTKKSAIDNYLMIRNMITQRLSYRELRGPLSIAKVAYLIADEGFGYFLKFLAFLSINLAVINFLPIPVLDGGHMVFLIWELITGKKPNEKIMVGAIYIGLVFILSLMALVMYLDIFVHGIFSGK